jgi:hypothetical protein
MLNVLARGGEESTELLTKIASVTDLKGGALETFQTRIGEVGKTIFDRKIEEDERRKHAGGLSGRLMGSARAQQDAAKVATEDGQKTANKFLNHIAAATKLMALGGDKTAIALKDMAAQIAKENG